MPVAEQHVPRGASVPFGVAAMTAVDWTERFIGTRALPRELRDRLLRVARVPVYRRGQSVFGPLNRQDSLLLLLEGTIGVSQTPGNGRDVVLYRVDAGESRVPTTACMLAEEAYNAEGVAEMDVQVVQLPEPAFDALAVRDLVFAGCSRRLIDILRGVGDVAFGRIAVRVADRLLVPAGDGLEIAATHQQIADELGTAREVVSRMLHDFQKRGLVAQSRDRVGLADKPGLRALAGNR